MEDIIELDGRDFLIVQKIEYNNNDYIYAISTDEKRDIALLKESEENGKFYIKSVNDINEFNAVLNYIN